MKFVLIILFLTTYGVVNCQSIYLKKIDSLIINERYQEAFASINLKLNIQDLQDSIYIKLLFARAGLFARFNNYEDAKKDWTKLIEKNPDEVLHYNGLAFVHWNLKEYKEAFERI